MAEDRRDTAAARGPWHENVGNTTSRTNTIFWTTVAAYEGATGSIGGATRTMIDPLNQVARVSSGTLRPTARGERNGPLESSLGNGRRCISTRAQYRWLKYPAAGPSGSLRTVRVTAEVHRPSGPAGI